MNVLILIQKKRTQKKCHIVSRQPRKGQNVREKKIVPAMYTAVKQLMYAYSLIFHVSKRFVFLFACHVCDEQTDQTLWHDSYS